MNWNPFNLKRPPPLKRKTNCAICGEEAIAHDEWDGEAPLAHIYCQIAKQRKLDSETEFTPAELRQIKIIKVALAEYFEEEKRKELFP